MELIIDQLQALCSALLPSHQPTAEHSSDIPRLTPKSSFRLLSAWLAEMNRDMQGWWSGFLMLGFVGLLLFTAVAQTQYEEPPADLLCISECTTCPVICSPPPSPYYGTAPSPKSTPIEYSPPPPPHVHQSPPSPPPQSNPAQPPPPPKIQIVPSVSTPSLPTASMRNYTYPYYYFYASNAATISLLASFLPTIFFLLASYLV